LASVPGVPDSLAKLVAQLLRTAPAERPQSASEVLSRLDRSCPPSRRRRKLSRKLLATALVTGAVLVSLAGLNLGGWRDRPFAGPAAANIRSLAVLPLDNFSRDPEQEYFADGMTEELIANLAKISSLRVISRTSVMRYKGALKPLREIARELKVDAVVEGSVLREGERVRITAQLIHGPSEKHLWAESYQRASQDVLALQSEVALAIAKEIRVQLTRDERAHLGSSRQVNPKAHEAYLKGRYHLDRVTEEEVKKSREYFEQAIQIDPGYAPAYSGLGDSYATSATWGWVPSKEGFPKAKTATLKALELDPTFVRAHSTLAWIKWRFEWDWAGAEREFKHAIELEASNAVAHERFGRFLSILGRHSEAVVEGKRAQELDPLTLRVTANLGLTYIQARQYEQAIQEHRKALEMDPNFAVAHGHLANAY